MAKEAQLYEIGLLIHPELPEERASEVLGTVRSYIEKSGGVLESTVDPKLRRLGYAVKKNTQAYFAALQCVIAPEAVTKVKKEVDGNTNILRHLILTWKKEAPRTILRRNIEKPEGSVASPPVVPFTPAEKKEENKTDIQEIDKKLDEILGNQ